MSFTTGKRGNTVFVAATGPLVVSNRQELKRKVLDHVEDGERRFVIDFSGTSYIDSSGLGVLVSLSKKIKEKGGELRLANLNSDLRTLFELTKLDELFLFGSEGDGAEGVSVPAPVRPRPHSGGAEQPIP